MTLQPAERSGNADGPCFPDVTGLSPLDAALVYAKAGIPVIPIRSGTKNPGSLIGPAWPQRATCDLDTVRDWWTRWPDAGIATHVYDAGLIVLDVDKPQHVPAWLWPLLQRAVFRPTRIPVNRRGHYVYRLHPGDVYGNVLGALKPPQGERWGDVKCLGGCVVLGPTRHQRAAEGGHYCTSASGAIPYLPAELAERLTAAPDRTAPAAATGAQVRAFMTDPEHCLALEPYALDPIVRTFNPTPSARHGSMFEALCWAMREAKAGRFPAQHAADALRWLWDEATTGEGREAEFDRMLGAAVAEADRHTVDELWDRCHRTSTKWGPA